MGSFKKFSQYIHEESEENSDSSITPKCDRCGKSELECKCYSDDYYDANIDHYTPKGKTKKGNYHG